jgi:hypothetical protein|mmetsp:Transcript_19686/g.30879  ORF Transcript_19686/g.30879 Transcript_19686/m.30879 type:complete len:97 (-) Transcript_19686:461-751(-)
MLPRLVNGLVGVILFTDSAARFAVILGDGIVSYDDGVFPTDGESTDPHDGFDSIWGVARNMNETDLGLEKGDTPDCRHGRADPFMAPLLRAADMPV